MVAEDVHIAFASVFQACYKTEAVVGEGFAFGNVTFNRILIEKFSMVGHAHKAAAVGEEGIAKFPKGELAVGVRAMNVKGAFQHEV